MDEKEIKKEAGKIIEKVKELVKEGNVSRIRLTRNGETLVSIPVNVGIVGALIGLHAAPFIVLTSALAAYGMKCKVEIVKKDGTVEEIKEAAEEASGEASELFGKVKEAFEKIKENAEKQPEETVEEAVEEAAEAVEEAVEEAAEAVEEAVEEVTEEAPEEE